MSKTSHGEAGSAKQKTMTTKQNQVNKANHARQNERTILKKETAFSNVRKQQGGIGQRLGEKTTHVLDMKNCLINKRKQAKQQVQVIPTHVEHVPYQGKENVTHNVTDFK